MKALSRYTAFINEMEKVKHTKDLILSPDHRVQIFAACIVAESLGNSLEQLRITLEKALDLPVDGSDSKQ